MSHVPTPCRGGQWHGAAVNGPAPIPAVGCRRRDSTAEAPRRPGGRLPVLDGLRGIAVLAVMAFHAGVPGVRGGLLGVDIFFVLSGFLITALLLAEHTRDGRISLADFWRRRLRRLMPAMLLMLVVTVVVWRFTAEPSDLPGLRRDALSTLAYVANWHFAAAGQSYFDHFAAPVAAAAHVVAGGRGAVLPGLAVRGHPRAAPGQHHARCDGWRSSARCLSTGLLAVAVAEGPVDLAPLLRHRHPGRRAAGRRGPRHADHAVRRERRGGPAVAPGSPPPCSGWGPPTLLVAALLRVDGQSPELYRGGFLAVALLVGLLVASTLLAPSSPIARGLSFAPLRAVGRISYGLYLWHWPVFLFLSSARTGLSGPALLAVRVTATGLVAAASWFLVERRFLAAELARVTAPSCCRRPRSLTAVALVAVPLPRRGGGRPGRPSTSARSSGRARRPRAATAAGRPRGAPVRCGCWSSGTARP